MHTIIRDLKLSIDYYTNIHVDFTYTRTSRVAFLVIFSSKLLLRRKQGIKNLISEKACRQIYARLL